MELSAASYEDIVKELAHRVGLREEQPKFGDNMMVMRKKAEGTIPGAVLMLIQEASPTDNPEDFPDTISIMIGALPILVGLHMQQQARIGSHLESADKELKGFARGTPKPPGTQSWE